MWITTCWRTKMRLPIVKHSDYLGVLGVNLVNDQITDMGHIFRENTTRDFGVDGQIEIVIESSGERNASGRLIAVQIKCGDYFFSRDDGNNWINYFSEIHANYWENFSIPVILIICDPQTRQCYWNLVDENSLIRTKEGAKILVPKNNVLKESQKKLENISCNKKKNDVIHEQNKFIFSLNENYKLDIPKDELEVFCGEIYHACMNRQNILFDVRFENEIIVINEADKIRLGKNISVEMRRRLLDLEQIHMWILDKRKMIIQGLNLLFNEDFFRNFFVLDNNYTDLAKVVNGFINHFIYERVSKRENACLTLDVFPNKKHTDLVVKVDLDKEEEKSFLSKIDTKGSIEQLKYGGYCFLDLNHSIIIERGIPAVLTYITYYLRNKKIDKDDFFCKDLEPLWEWGLGLA
ncbi:TPA: DUF4365 domain-containing protein [Citrobacter youngae]|nr:DUF4365 domain-containing protein [Citrobacter youngae]HEF0090188.1 DUF4365 domain-containing protein [Citrobacter youngae]